MSISNFTSYSLAIIRVGGRTQEFLVDKGADFRKNIAGMITPKTREEKIIMQRIDTGLFEGLLGLVQCEIPDSDNNMSPKGLPLEIITNSIKLRLGMEPATLEFCGFVYEMASGENNEKQNSRYFVYLNKLKRHSTAYVGKDFHILDMYGLATYDILAPKQKIHPTHKKIIEIIKESRLHETRIKLNLKIELRQKNGVFKVT